MAVVAKALDPSRLAAGVELFQERQVVLHLLVPLLVQVQVLAQVHADFLGLAIQPYRLVGSLLLTLH